MSKMKQQLLEVAFPPESRDAMTTFVIDNGAVLDALRAILEDISSGSAFPNKVPKRVRLVGGREQAQILLDLVAENGLSATVMSVLGGPTEVFLNDPLNRDFHLIVKCDFNFNDDVKDPTGYIAASSFDRTQEE